MTTRLTVRDNESPDRARQRFDGQLGVRDWATPATGYQPPPPRELGAPWWWRGAEDATQSFMAMARARGMVQ